MWMGSESAFLVFSIGETNLFLEKGSEHAQFYQSPM
jgi:hypothetical protein